MKRLENTQAAATLGGSIQPVTDSLENSRWERKQT